MRVSTRAVVVYTCAALMMILTVRTLVLRGGPYFEIPETVFDHLRPDPTLSRQAIVMSRKAAPLMPRGSSVTVINPAQTPHYDPTLYLTSSGMLPHHSVRHPTLLYGEQWPDFVIALGEPLEHRGYRLVRQFHEGRLYELQR